MKDLLVRHSDHGFKAELFDPAKLHASLTYFCSSVNASEGAAIDITERAVAKVINWLEGKSEVTNDDIRRIAGDTLESLCPEAGYLYKNEKSII